MAFKIMKISLILALIATASSITPKCLIPPSTPSPSPSKAPVPSPTPAPSKAPIHTPGPSPTLAPSKAPVHSPGSSPSKAPVHSPGPSPSKAPVHSPGPSPSKAPVHSPGPSPSKAPVHSPGPSPSKAPVTPVPSPTPTPTPAPAPPSLCSFDKNCPAGFQCHHHVCEKATGCFPGDALVQLSSGSSKYMSELAVGDRVAVGVDAKGVMTYSDVYAFGHKDSNALFQFVRISLESSAGHVNHLEVTSGHFVPTSTDKVYKRAEEIKAGDVVWATNGNSTLLPYSVKGVSNVEKTGLFNPLTLRGDILVNGVMASSHSDWFLDPIFDAFGLTHWLPYAYQSLLSPVRLVYKLLGSEVYAAGYALLDGYVSVAQLGTEYGGSIAILAFGFAAAFAASRKLV